MEVAVSVIPPRVELGLVVVLAKHVDEIAFGECGEFVSLRLADMCASRVAACVVDVAVVWRDVEVADNRNGLSVADVGVHIGTQSVEPLQLVLVVVVVERAAIRDVTAGDAYAATRGPDDPRVDIGVAAIAEVDVHVVEADTRDDGDPVPLTLSVMRRLVSALGEDLCGEVLGGELCFLHAHHVGL